MSDALQKLIQQAETQKLKMEAEILFKKNMALFQSRFPQIYELAKNHKPEKFLLSIDTNRNLNLTDVEKRSYLYQGKPIEICLKQADQFAKNGQVRRLKVGKSVEYNKRHIHIKHVSRLIDEYEKSEPERITQTPSLLTNLIVSGIGLGYHLIEFVKRFDVHNIFIYENCNDVFHASLHTIDWQLILDYFRVSHRSITFCLGMEPEKTIMQMEKFIHNHGLFSQVFSFIFCHSKRKSDQRFVEVCMKEIKNPLTALGFFDDEQIGLAHAYHNLQAKNFIFFNKEQVKRKSRVIVIGNGPSLDMHEAYLKRNADNAILLSCGSSLSSLLRMGIKPDFQIVSERTISMNDFLTAGSTKEMREGITLLCLHTASPETINAFEEVCLAIKPNDAGGALMHQYYQPYKIPELAYCNPSVANCGLAFAIFMGFLEIHLVGVDFGLPEEGKHHSKHSLHHKIENYAEGQSKLRYHYKDDKNIYREGNFGGTVKSHNILDASRHYYERLLGDVRGAFPDMRCINTNNGVKIKFTESVKLDDLPDATDYDKQSELRSVRENNFLHYHNKDFDKNFDTNLESTSLAYFFLKEKEFYLSENINSELELQKEFKRIYSLAKKEHCPITHFLMRGSLNVFFGAITQNVMYCKHHRDFLDRLDIGRTIFNEFLTLLFHRMHEDPFRLDDTENPMVVNMHKQQNEQQNKQQSNNASASQAP